MLSAAANEEKRENNTSTHNNIKGTGDSSRNRILRKMEKSQCSVRVTQIQAGAKLVTKSLESQALFDYHIVHFLQ
jgi:hypothetical protein